MSLLDEFEAQEKGSSKSLMSEFEATDKPEPTLKDKIYSVANKIFQPSSVTDGLDGTAVTQPPSANVLQAFKNVMAEKPVDPDLKPGAKVVDGLGGIAEVGARRGYAGIAKMESGVIKALADVLSSDSLNQFADNQRQYANDIENGAVLRGKPIEGFSKESIVQDVPEASANALSSVIQTAPAIGAGVVAPEVTLPAIFASTTAQEYGNSRDSGLTPAGAAIRAPIQGAFEVLGEKLGGAENIAKALNKAGSGNGVVDLAQALVQSSLKEVPSEELTTTGQFLADKLPGVGTNQEAGIDDYKKAVKDTALATLIQSGAMGAGGKALESLANRPNSTQVVNEPEPTPQPAANQADIIDALTKAKDLITNPTQKLEISQGDAATAAADDAVAAQHQAEADAQQAAPNNAPLMQEFEASEASNDNKTTEQAPSMGAGTVAAQPDNGAGSNGADVLEQPARSDIPAEAGTSSESNISAPVDSQPSDSLEKRVADNRETLQSWIPDMDWEQIGGRIIRDQEGQVSARTTWEPKDYDFESIRKDVGVSYGAMRKAVEKAVSGQKLGSKETKVVSALMDFHDEMAAKQDPADSWTVASQEQADKLNEALNDEAWLDFVHANATTDDVANEISQYYEQEHNANQEVARANDETNGQTESTAGQGTAREPQSIRAEPNAAPIENQPSQEQPSRSNETTGSSEQSTPVSTPPDERIKQHVEALIKRRAAANQLGKAKLKLYDTALGHAKDLMNGVAVNPNKFKNAASALNGDKQLADTLTSLQEIAKAPAKESRANRAQLVDSYKERIANAKGADELQTLAKDIQNDTNLTDQQAQDLDDLVFDAQDQFVDDNKMVNSDLLGQDTSKEQAVADAARAKDEKRNSGDTNSSDFKLTGSNSEADKAAANGAQSLFSVALKTDTDAFKKWFGDSKVVDAEGNPLVVYHGTPNASFDEFKEESHFTDNPEYASVYTNTAASSGSTAKRAEAPAVYPVYLSIEKPFDTRQQNIKEIFKKEFFGKWGNNTPLSERGLPDWTDSRDLLEWIEETNQPFDGLILDEGGTPEGGFRGLSWVPVKATQIKSAVGNNGEFNSNNPRINFSKSDSSTGITVDEVRKVIADDIYNQDIDVYQTMADAPKYIQDQVNSENADGIEGFFDIRANRVALIAGNLPDVNRAKEVARHELIGHYGMENMLGKDLMKSLISRVVKAESAGNKTIKDMAEQVDRTQPGLSEARRAKEIIAVMAERNLQNDIVKRVIDAVRKFLKRIGFIKDDITDAEVASLLRDAQKYLSETGRSIAEPDTGLAFSRKDRKPSKDDGDTYLTAALEYLARDPELFQRPLTEAKSIYDIAKELDPGYRVEQLGRSMTSEKKADRAWEVYVPGSNIRSGIIMTKDKDVWIDVQYLQSGVDRGSAIYDMAAAYAHNNGKVLIGDPLGLTRRAFYRRNENMLSSALKYGTTKHLEPHLAQEIPGEYYTGHDAPWGKAQRAIDWQKGNDVHNIKELVYNSWKSATDNIPELKDVIFNPENGKFEYTDGRPFTAADSERIATELARQPNNPYRAGSGTIKRAALFNTFLRREGGEGRQQILGKLVTELSRNGLAPDLKRVMYSRSSPKDTPERNTKPKGNWLFRKDDLGRYQLAPTGKAYDVISNITNNIADKVQFGLAPPALRTQIRHFKADMQKALDSAHEVAKAMSPMSLDDRKMVSDVVERMMKPGVIPPDHVLQVAAGMQQTMDAQTDELVKLGMLNKESADRWRGKYLPRFYNREQDPALDSLAKKLFKAALPVRGLGGGSLKGRGLYQEIDVKELPNWESLGWEVRDPLWKKNQSGKLELIDKNKVAGIDKVLVWRDFTPEERATMNENRDALFRYVMGYTAMQNDIALGRLFDGIAKNTEWTRPRPSEGYTKVPDSDIAETGGVKKYGNLAGLYVRDDIIQHITQFEESSDLVKYYKKALSFWKAGRTVLNPVAHMNNVISNLTMAHFAGVSYWDSHKYIGALSDFVKNAPMIQEAKDIGLMTGDITRAELIAEMPDDIKAMLNQQESKIAKSAKLTYQILTFGLTKPMGKAYRFEDDFFKYLIYRDARKNGMEPDDAVDYATQFIFNYDDLPKTARVIRDVGIPFFAYTYKAVPALANTLFNYPWRFAAPALAIAGVNALAYGLIAGDDDDDLKTKYEKGQKLEEEERKHLPPWMQGKSAMGTEKTIRLGTDPKTGLPIFMDVSRYIPGGDMFDLNNQDGGLALPAPIMPSNPVLTTIAAMIWNKDTFTGKDIVDKNDTSKEAAQKRSEWLLKMISPAIAPTGYHADRLAQAGAEMAGTTIETPFKDYTGRGKDGLPVQPAYAVAQTLGIKARPVDLEMSADISRGQDYAEVKSIRSEIMQAKRLLNKGAISQREFDETRRNGLEKIKKIRSND